MNLYNKLIEYSKDTYYPFHMPGHKRNTELLNMGNPYSIDITEIEGFDNLHHAEGILLEGRKRAAEIYGSAYTNYLIGGSTAGILAGISACTKKGDKVLIARNSHKSVYHAIYLNELNPIYIYPQRIKDFSINGGIDPVKVEEMLIKHSDIKLVVITSPTYEGIVSDVDAISKITHKYKVPLLVDEAHGAHLGFHPDLPRNSVQQDADVVIHSLHKTLPAFTQSGLIHVNGSLVDNNEVTRYLGIYQTSSPSYLLMSGIEQCITILEQNKDELFESYNKRLNLFYKEVKDLKKIKILTKQDVLGAGNYDFDWGKLVISVKDITLNGNDVYHILLDKYKLQMEMVSKDYLLGMTSICDTDIGFIRLVDALFDMDFYAETDQNRNNKIDGGSKEFMSEIVQPDIVMLANQAMESEMEWLPIEQSGGRVTAEYVYLYPPGIPILVPGERITKDILRIILDYKENGLSLQGMLDVSGRNIKVVKEIN